MDPVNLDSPGYRSAASPTMKSFKQQIKTPSSYLGQVVFEEWVGFVCIFQLREVSIGYLRANVKHMRQK